MMKNNPNNQFATKRDLQEMRGEIRKDILGFKDEIKDYMGVLHEQFFDQVKIVAEQYSSIDKRLMNVEIKTDMLVETVGEIKMEMTEMKSDMSELKTDMKEVKEELLPNTTRKINKLEHRVVVLESRA